ncbi:MAG: glycosyltransferase family 4 protein [Candidatus Jordarchaeum sp.]|uniref:glycosyltransferase family 4 protein n=1 Tax=Candidatus Jordarchaeum sp. TaxID=2823881 RepID=UPI00404963CD
MRICLLSYRGNMYCGGQGVYLYNISKALAELGNEVHVIVGPPYPFKMEWATVHKIKTPRFNEISPDRITSENLSPLTFYEYMAARFGNFPEIMSFSIRAFLKVKDLIKDYHFDIIHDNQCLGYGLLLMKALHVPLIATIHHPLPIDRQIAMYLSEDAKTKVKQILFYPQFMQKIVAKRINRIITVSEFSANEIVKHFKVPRNRISVVHNGVDTELFHVSEKLSKNLDSDYYDITFVGNCENRVKGLPLLLKTLKYLKEDLGMKVKLTIVDKWKEEGIAPPLVERYGLEDDIIFTGFLTFEELSKRYATTDLIIIPSLFEGFCFPAVEAMACGTPVVAFKVGALPQVMEDGKTGVLAEPGDWRAMAKAVVKILKDKELRESMGKRGRERVEKLFTWKNAAEQVIEIYREIINAHR